MSVRGFALEGHRDAAATATPSSTSRSPANRPDCMSVIGIARESRRRTAFRCGARSLAASARTRPLALRLTSLEDRREVGHRRRHREPGPVPALRRRRRRRDRRALARLDAGAAAGRRRPPDQQHRRRHQLRAARARPADARVRPREARAARRFACGRRRPARRIKTLDGQTRDARRPTCWSSPTPSGPSPSPA